MKKPDIESADTCHQITMVRKLSVLTLFVSLATPRTHHYVEAKGKSKSF